MIAQADMARRFVAALAAAGVRDLVVSPGSRSTPLVLAALDCGDLRCRAIIDERSAAFFALGMAKRSGRPVAALCTSGTAGAHYYPAAIEAAYSYTPLVLITADRPAELQGCGAPQTIDQIDLFHKHVRAAVAVDPDDDAAAAKVATAVAAARSPVPGPVHLNVRLRKPLETRASQAVVPPIPRTYAAPHADPPADAVRALADACAAERGVIVAGPAPLAQRRARAAVEALACATGYPLVAEAASQLKFGVDVSIDGFPALLSAEAARERLRPELILQLGAMPVSTAWREYQTRWADVPRWVIAPWGRPDPLRTATAHVAADVGRTAAAVAEAIGCVRAPTAWATAWRAGALAPGPAADAVRTAVRALPPAGVVCAGNSLPIRWLDAACSARDTDADVWSQRGVAGIDGLISGAAGAAAAGDSPTLLLVGDVSFAHDIGGLAAARDVRTPLAIVVLDNGGGRIFDELPVAAAVAPDDLSRWWTTPPRVDLAAAARAFGVPYAPMDDASLAAAFERRGPTLLHAEVGA
ncbi:MAG: 2-succinyl-5-enolpyruvyl-6-hydroxy-3-cyclohexene-1-carboxylic-acid synthase [Deltaproteobacteria bacterium]|nr:MAG: 2-succinyl-5-enolpyruvyl-6-hydroxy-3-cyclohexene-1-carboxylic-acid synthase [Deltaproteobacteria bacterium]